jgi:hypothetical protein
MRVKIRCDGWKRKYFGYAWQVNAAPLYLHCPFGFGSIRTLEIDETRNELGKLAGLWLS